MSVRTFDGTDDFIRCTGSAGQIGNGAFTMVALVRPTSVPGSDENYFGFSAGTGTSMANLYADNGNSGANLGWGGNVSDSVGNAGMTEDVWQVIAASKDSGTEVARFHRKVLGSGSWTHINGTGNTVNDTTNVTDAWFGKFHNGSGIRDCDIAVCAAFSAELSDADIEGIETAASTQELLDLGAIHVWELNQPSTAIPLFDKVGNLHQSAITGTSVTEGADPAWTYLDADGTPDFPYIVSEGSQSQVTTGTLSPTIPTHQADDILVCAVAVWVPNTAGSAAVIPTPTDWTKQGSVQFPGTPDGECALFWRRATGSGTTVTFTRGASWDTGTDGVYAARAWVIRGCIDTGDPWDEFDATAALTGANGSVDALTVSGDDRTAIQFLAKTDDFVTAPTLSGWTAGTQTESTTGTDSSFGAFFKYGVSSSTSADASTVEAPAAGAYVFFGASFKPPATGATLERSAALDAAGAIATTATFFSVFSRSAAIDGAGAIASVPQRDLLRAAAIDAAGSIASVPQRDRLRSAAIDATGAIETSGTFFSVFERSAAIDGTGDISASGVRVGAEFERSAAIDATAAIASSGTFFTVFERSAAIDGTGSIASVPFKEALRQVALSATAGIATSAEFFTVFERSAALDATGAITSAAIRVHIRSAAISATAAISAVPQRELFRQAAIDGAALIQTVGEIEGGSVTHSRSAALDATAAIASDGEFDHNRSAAVSATGAIATSATFYSIVERSAAIDATGAIASTSAPMHNRSAAIGATAGVTTAHQRELMRSGTFDATGQIASNAVKETTRAVVLAAAADISSAGSRVTPWSYSTDGDADYGGDDNWTYDETPGATYDNEDTFSYS